MKYFSNPAPADPVSMLVYNDETPIRMAFGPPGRGQAYGSRQTFRHEGGCILSPHKFRIGDSVHFTSGMFGRGGAAGVYEVVRLLPTEGDEQQYRIKSATEPHERVAKQSQLERTA